MGNQYIYCSNCLLHFFNYRQANARALEELLGFDEFAQRLEKILSIGGGGVTAAWDITIAMVALWGIPLFIGCIPWAIISGLIGYYWTLKYKEGRRRRRSSVA